MSFLNIYAALIHFRIGHASGHERGWGVLLIPFTTAALSFCLAFTGICLLTAASSACPRMKAIGAFFAAPNGSRVIFETADDKMATVMILRYATQRE